MFKTLTLTLAVFFLGALTLGLSGCGGGSTENSSAPLAPSKAADAEGSQDPETLVVSLLPDQDVGTIIKNNAGLKKYLEDKLSKKVELTVSTNYAAMIESVRQGQVHLAFFGPASYIKAKALCQIEPFAALINNGKPTYYAVLIANVNSGIKNLDDLKAKKDRKVLLGDKLSTGSSYGPRAVLFSAGLSEGKDYESSYLGKHDAVAFAIEAGNGDVGGLSKEYFEMMLASKKIDGNKVKIIATSPELTEYPWTVQMSLKKELREKIKQAFYDLKDKQILQYLKNADGFAPVTDASYEGVRKVVEMVDKMEADVKAGK